MNARERAEYLEDGLSVERREQFRVAEQSACAWQRTHPRSLDDYFDFLEALEEIFGPLSRRREPWVGDDFRL